MIQEEGQQETVRAVEKERMRLQWAWSMVRVGKVQRWEEAQEAAEGRRRLHVKGTAGGEGMLFAIFTSLVIDVDDNHDPHFRHVRDVQQGVKGTVKVNNHK